MSLFCSRTPPEIIRISSKGIVEKRSGLTPQLKVASTKFAHASILPPLASSTHIPDNPRGATGLPRIVIPSCSGQREDRDSFRDLFKSLIHEDSNFSNVGKLYYLKTHVQGDARFAIDDLQVTAANYAIAWNHLEARYDHRRLLVQDHLKALKTLRPLKEESSANLQHLLDELKRHRNHLRILCRPVDNWDDWLVLLASDAMDPVTRRD